MNDDDVVCVYRYNNGTIAVVVLLLYYYHHRCRREILSLYKHTRTVVMYIKRIMYAIVFSSRRLSVFAMRFSVTTRPEQGYIRCLSQTFSRQTHHIFDPRERSNYKHIGGKNMFFWARSWNCLYLLPPARLISSLLYIIVVGISTEVEVTFSHYRKTCWHFYSFFTFIGRIYVYR